MKTCTNCHRKRKKSEFVEQCGKTAILNFVCQECRDKSRITQEQSDQLIRCISERFLTHKKNQRESK